MTEQHVESTRTTCPDCAGAGQLMAGEYYVTREMALDAGEPAMEGQLYSVEYVQCQRCEGRGTIEEEPKP